MDIILVHLGEKEPPYLWDCVKQIRNFTDSRVIIVLPEFPEPFRVSDLPPNTLISTIGALEPPKCSTWNRFCDIGYYATFGGEALWQCACERFYVIETLMAALGIDQALHLEYDNLIYAKPDETFLKELCGESIGLTEITDTLLTAGIMYIGSRAALSRMNNALNDLMEIGQVQLESKYGPEMMHEMRMLKIVSQENKGLISLLPPFPSHNSEFVYDGASWGQFVGGTVHTPGQPFAHDSHIVGREINRGWYKVSWSSQEHGRVPFVSQLRGAGKNAKLFNLHIHSKELQKWMSK